MATKLKKQDNPKSEKLWAAAEKIIPGGTQTFSKGPQQYVKGVAPKYIQRGKGSHVWDADGHEFVDFVLGLGPVILGYAYPRVDEAIAKQLKDGIAFPLMHPLEVELSQKLVELIPSAEMVRFGKNGSDATAAAVRVSRAHTKRDKIACCGYHGWQDWFIGTTTRNLGVPDAVRKLTLPFKYNDIDSLKALFDQNPGQIAAVILEPTLFVAPKDDFLKKVKELAHKNGAVLIFDEVITGFRIALGGAQEYFGVTPDLSTFGKALGNGMPISAIVGKAEIMSKFNDVFFSFTAGGEALSLAASLATVAELQEKKALKHVWAMGDMLRDGYNAMAKDLKLEASTRMIGYGFWPEMEFNGKDGKHSFEIQTLVTQELIKRGVLTRAGMVLCYSHTPEDIRKTLAAQGEALEILRDALKAGDVASRLEGELIPPVIRAS
ncbi:MAG: aminotransferase class III-fold pyridoxal phosphate-dependent enzyme [Elusimicrobia bacterium]|nr:aminotransferase class III-fold pyridoxal phosphate-dependent enzyme [Elusimicrobiota bacterium]